MDAQNGALAIAYAFAHPDIGEEENPVSLEHFAAMALHAARERDLVVLMALDDVLHPQRVCVGRQQLLFVAGGKPGLRTRQARFQQRIRGQQLPAGETVAVHPGFEIEFQLRERAAAGIPGVAEEPIVDARAEGQAGEESVEGGSDKAVAFEVGQKIGGLFRLSDLGRAMETAAIAFQGMGKTILADWRLRECDYGRLNGMPAIQLHARRRAYLDEPYPEGESWRQAIGRVDAFLSDLQGPLGGRWSSGEVLIIGHVATRWALDCRLAGRTLEDLIDEDFAWREGWDYELDAS